jgi:hypothetical protein
VRTWCLEFHAEYRCRHAGACCRAAWDIEVEPAVVKAVTVTRIVPLHAAVQPFRTDAAGLVTLERTSGGDCHFHAGARCALQQAGGEALLPSACWHFPRVLLLDGRGCLLTLSHYCPTAAALLVDGGSIRVVEAVPPLALTGPLEGLDASDAVPPLLRPGMLIDVADYGRFEAACLRTLGEGADAASSLARIAAAAEAIRSWCPGGEPLAGRIDAAFAEAVPSGTDDHELSSGLGVVRTLTGPHPDMDVPVDFAARWTQIAAGGGRSLQELLARYLAASTFGNWMAYRGQGLRSTIAWLRACYDVLRLQIVREAGDADGITRGSLIRSVRAADYLLVHTVDSLAFGRAVAPCERRIPSS